MGIGLRQDCPIGDLDRVGGRPDSEAAAAVRANPPGLLFDLEV